jgi:hypothetical protein
MTTKQEIRDWLSDSNIEMRLSEGQTRGDITHMVVVCDTFDWSDYPVYVASNEDVREVYGKYNGPNMQKVMEVYSFNRNLEDQLNEGRAKHFD